jgi:hypothetical protein
LLPCGIIIVIEDNIHHAAPVKALLCGPSDFGDAGEHIPLSYLLAEVFEDVLVVLRDVLAVGPGLAFPGYSFASGEFFCEVF